MVGYAFSSIIMKNKENTPFQLQVTKPHFMEHKKDYNIFQCVENFVIYFHHNIKDIQAFTSDLQLLSKKSHTQTNKISMISHKIQSFKS